MKIEKNKKYKIKGKSQFFLNKYGTSNPVFMVECRDVEAWKGGWMEARGNIACVLFAMRTGTEGPRLPLKEPVYYGHVECGNGARLGEVVYGAELERMTRGRQALIR